MSSMGTGVGAAVCVLFICQPCLDNKNHCPGTRERWHKHETPGGQGEQDHPVLDPTEQETCDTVQRELPWSINASEA